MGITIREYFQFKKFRIRMQEVSIVHIHPGLEKGWAGYRQLAGSWYASTKRAEIEVLSCMRGYYVYKDR